MNTQAVVTGPHRVPAGPVGEFVSATIVLGIAGVCLWLIATTTQPFASSEGGANSAVGVPAPVVQLRAAEAAAGSRLLIITVGEGRAQEVRVALVQESTLRDALDEPARDAEVIAAATVEEAEMILAIVAGDSAVPGASAMNAVVVH